MVLTEEAKKDVLAKAQVYLAFEKDEKFKGEVTAAMEKGDYDDLYDRFYTALAFGTAGMRGVIGGGTNRINTYMVRRVTQGLADYLNKAVSAPSVAIAYDSRHYSKEFALSAALVLSANGVKTYLYDTLHPVPMLSFCLRNLKTTAGIVITASHNPSKYNGYKVYWSDGGQVTPPHDIGITDCVKAVKDENVKDIAEADARKSGILQSVPASVDEAYYNMVISSLRRPELVKGSPVQVAYTPLHGSGLVPLTTMLGKLGMKVAVVEEQKEPNGDFPTVKLPNPESAEAMTKVIALAKSVKADIVLGTDPDADRLGIAIPKTPAKDDYLLLTGNQIATLLADYLIETSKELGLQKAQPMLVKSLVTTDLVKKIAEANGGQCRDVLTGFKYIAEQMQAIDDNPDCGRYYLFGCEESYGFLTVNDVRDKDAVSSAVAAVEMMSYYASKGITLQDRLDAIYEKYGYSTEVVFARDYEGAAGKEEMARIMAKTRALKAGDVLVNRKIASVVDLKGENTGFPKADVIIIRYESGEKLVVRPSGTEPKIKYYLFLTGDRKTLEANKAAITDEFKAGL
ncbi:MAG: phospho-sugar mutase [Spirochaetales bacterium]|nr:phospho-sugar mutase [Candidatus Physcosoma equi]